MVFTTCEAIHTQPTGMQSHRKTLPIAISRIRNSAAGFSATALAIERSSVGSPGWIPLSAPTGRS